MFYTSKNLDKLIKKYNGKFKGTFEICLVHVFHKRYYCSAIEFDLSSGKRIPITIFANKKLLLDFLIFELSASVTVNQ